MVSFREVLAHTLVHKVFVEFFTYADVKMRTVSITMECVNSCKYVNLTFHTTTVA